MDVALQLLQLLTVYSRMHADAPIKSRDKSLWVPTTVWHTYTEAHQWGVVGGEVETAEIILFIAAATAAETSSPSNRKEALWS